MNKKILVIEDDVEILDNIKILLELEKYSVLVASSGMEGISVAKSKRPDLIICDIMMPDVDGYEVLKQISKEDSLNLIPFIFLTAKVERTDLRKGMELGADDYIFKPFDADDLLGAIHTRLNKYEIIKAKIDETKNNEEAYTADSKILFRVRDHSVLVSVGKIIFIAADSQYSNVYVEDKKHYVIKKSLSKWEKVLPHKVFVRIHRSTLINLNFVTKIEKNDNDTYNIFLKGSEKIFHVSRRFYKLIRKIK